MSKKANPITSHIIQALISTGYSQSAARSIAYGAKEMRMLSKAKQMQHSPWYISIDLWQDLYKQKQSE